MVTLDCGSLRIEAAAVPEPDGGCFVTAEVYEGLRMLRSYCRRIDAPTNDLQAAARGLAEEVARMASESE